MLHPTPDTHYLLAQHPPAPAFDSATSWAGKTQRQVYQDEVAVGGYS